MKNSTIILEFQQDGFHIKASLIHVPRKGVYACKAVIKYPKPRICQTIYIDGFLYPDHLDVIKDQIISEIRFTRETLLKK